MNVTVLANTKACSTNLFFYYTYHHKVAHCGREIRNQSERRSEQLVRNFQRDGLVLFENNYVFGGSWSSSSSRRSGRVFPSEPVIFLKKLRKYE